MRSILPCLWLMCIVAQGCGKESKAEKPDATVPTRQKAEDIAWGQPVKGLRMGLSPTKIVLAQNQTGYKVTVWYENVGRETGKVPEQKGSSLWNLMFAYEKDGRTSYIDHPGLEATMIPVHDRPLKPGERFSEEMPNELVNSLHPPAPLKLPLPGPGKSLTLRAGFRNRIDPAGQEDWNAADTLKSGAITVTWAAAADPSSNAPLLPKLADIKEITVDPRVVVGPDLKPRGVEQVPFDIENVRVMLRSWYPVSKFEWEHGYHHPGLLDSTGSLILKDGARLQ